MKLRKIFCLSATVAVIGSFISCGSGNVKGKILGDYVVELPVYTKLDYDKALKSDDENYGKFGCTGVVKTLENGDTVIGRSYDLGYSFKPAYIVRTAVPGFHKTVGYIYNTFAGPTFEEVKKNGIPADVAATLPFFTGELMNDAGFYAEANMRPCEPESTGIKESSGTNPGAEYRMTFAALIRFMGERAGSVDEALKIANSVDVHNFKTEHTSWGGGIILADSTGHYGVLELVDNKLVWSDMANAHANFYINDEYRERSAYRMGLGRYEVVKSGIDSVKTEEDMRKLITEVRYNQMSFDSATCKFNPLGEVQGEYRPEWEKWGGILSYKDAYNPANKDYIMSVLAKDNEAAKNATDAQLREVGLWQSAWQSVANCNKKTLKVTFFEDDNLTFDLTVE